MSKQNKDSLENFFRERTQGHNVEFNEGDWLKLEKQLDREMPVTFTFSSFLRKFWFIPLLVILIPAAWYSYSLQTKNLQKDGSRKLSASGSIVNTDELKNKVPHREENSSERKTSFTDNQKDFNGSTLQEKLTYINETSKSDPATKVTKNKIENSNQISAKQGIVLANNQEQPDVPQFENIGYAVLGNGAETNIDRTDFRLHFLLPIIPKSELDESIGSIDIEHKEINEISPTQVKKSYFNLGIGYSPDFSTVGIGNFISPGSRWTVLFEYGFTKRFMLNTGVVWVNNKYETNGKDYHAPSRYWKNGIVAEEAYGECKMIDIPLNLRYNFLSKGKNQVFVSAGASTYFLLQEDYYFHYDQEDPDLPDHWGTDKMTVYPFGIVNLSFGYQYQFSRKSGIQIEPFIKIPTSGIGWGKVDLHTLGVYFMYKYRITK